MLKNMGHLRTSSSKAALFIITAVTMNIHTFRDAVTSKRRALADEVDGEDDDDEQEVAPLRKALEGEEEEGAEKVSR